MYSRNLEEIFLHLFHRGETQSLFSQTAPRAAPVAQNHGVNTLILDDSGHEKRSPEELRILLKQLFSRQYKDVTIDFRLCMKYSSCVGLPFAMPVLLTPAFELSPLQKEKITVKQNLCYSYTVGIFSSAILLIMTLPFMILRYLTYFGGN